MGGCIAKKSSSFFVIFKIQTYHTKVQSVRIPNIVSNSKIFHKSKIYLNLKSWFFQKLGHMGHWSVRKIGTLKFVCKTIHNKSRTIHFFILFLIRLAIIFLAIFLIFRSQIFKYIIVKWLLSSLQGIFDMYSPASPMGFRLQDHSLHISILHFLMYFQ